ncbi:MAG: 50S ribosomal protein L6 [Gammaproteobacteria bacterium]|nr:MAG: 50S ribosomal protein L6 [Gammaproteobacteria bacterium]RLA14750.1 MAG: 50S ribosomal protein L6 [Gammaproteobacteria bacterium]
MSRIGKEPVQLVNGSEAIISEGTISVKGPKGTLMQRVNNAVSISLENGVLKFLPMDESKFAGAMTGTTRALVNNMVKGVTAGFSRELDLVGVGYRAQSKGQNLNLQLGFSHPVDLNIPVGLEIETPSQTKIVVKGLDKQKVGQFAAEIRALRPPEPYKGKGVRYSDEHVRRKEAKK